MAELIHPELSYKIIGILFKVYNQLGGGIRKSITSKPLRESCSWSVSPSWNKSGPTSIITAG